MASVIDQLNAAQSALVAVEANTRLTMFAERNADGTIAPPTGAKQFDVTLVTSVVDWGWGSNKGDNVRLQIDAYAKIPTESLNLLHDAIPAMIAAGFIPIGNQRVRAAPRGWVGHSQDFERGFA